MLMLRWPLFLITLSLLANNAFAGDFCGLADDVTEKAAVTFASDQDDALKLFIIARELCPNDAANAYNLGVAYYLYGNLFEAQQSFEEAVQKDGRNPAALNNLAQVMIERQGDAEKALFYAEKAVELDDTLAVQETLARARFAAGQSVQALDGLHEVLLESPEQRLQLSYDEILDLYLSTRVDKIKEGQQL